MNNHFPQPDPIRGRRLSDALSDAYSEALTACANWPEYNSAHEGLGVLLEEVKELQDHVFTKQRERDLSSMRREALQVAAVALRFASELCDEERGRR